MIDTAAAVVANASAKAANAADSDKACAIAPVANGAGRRVSALNNEADASPTAGPAAPSRAASAKLHGTIGPVPSGRPTDVSTGINRGKRPTSLERCATTANC